MSLIITSNVAENDRPEQSDVFKPYSYQNALSNTLRIPPNSEIALQSAKIVKNHLMVIDRANSGYCHYFGTPVGEEATEIEDIESSTSTPFFALGGTGEAFDDGRRNQVNTEDFADDLQASIREVAFHPSLIGQDATEVAAKASINCNPAFDTNGKFSGYKWDFAQQTAVSAIPIDNNKFKNISAFPQASFPFDATGSAGVIESTNSKGFQVRYDHKPIAQNAGEVIFDFRDANTTDAQSPFMCGLSRINTEKKISATKSVFAPLSYNVNRVSNIGAHFSRSGNVAFADICVMRAGSSLYIYQSGVNSGGNDSSGHLCMNEVIYYGAHNANFSAGRYNLQTTMAAEKYVKIKFKLENEHMSIFIGTAADSYVLLTDFIVSKSKGAVKNQVVNPINCAKWAMYPVMAASRGTGKKMKIEEIKSYNNYPVFSENEYFKYQWWGKLENEGLEHWATDVEKRFWNDKAITLGGSTNQGLLVPKVINAGGGMEDYSNTLILAKSNQYGADRTEDCNSQQTLGFMGRPISEPESSSTDILVNIQSEVVPALTSGASLFVRLNNFTQMSINARQGSVSKIVAHLPRFDNSGNETGALYFEPNSKTYIDLNNPEELVINSFDVDIVYDNETFCTALNGKTIVCFHIRQKM